MSKGQTATEAGVERAQKVLQLAEFRMVARSEINEAEYNPRDDLQPGDPRYEALGESLTTYGLVETLCWNEASGNLVGGHQRLKHLDEAGVDPVPCMVVSLDLDQERALNVALNNPNLMGDYDHRKLLAILQENDNKHFTGFGNDDVKALLDRVREMDEAERTGGNGLGGGASDGSLLALADISVGEPEHKVQRGDVWTIGRHYLIVLDVMADWSIWKKYLEDADGEDTLFIPYPGAFVPLTTKADERTLVMVQPDPYIAGHILDKYASVKGTDDIAKQEHVTTATHDDADDDAG